MAQAPAAPHSDLEVVPNSELPEQQKYAYYADPQQNVHSYHDADKVANAYAEGPKHQGKPATICGLKKKTFWIIVIVAIVLIAAAVGGGVGGALGSKKSDDSGNGNSAGAAASSGAQSSTSTSPTPTVQQSSTSVSSTTLVGPSSTIVRDCPSSNNTLYDVSFGSTRVTFRKACSISLLNANGIDSVVSTQTKSLNECIDQCASFNIKNRTQIEQGGRMCNSVCWRNTFDAKVNDFPGGYCFGFTSTNTSGQFTFRSPPETRCDSAGLITAPF